MSRCLGYICVALIDPMCSMHLPRGLMLQLSFDLHCGFSGESVLQWKARKEHLELKHLTPLSLWFLGVGEVPLQKDRTVTFSLSPLFI